MAVRGFRTKIALHISLLLLLSALITDVLVVLVVQGVLVRHHLNQQRLLLETVALAALDRKAHQAAPVVERDLPIPHGLSDPLQWSAGLIIDEDERRLYGQGSGDDLLQLRKAADAALQNGRPYYEQLRRTWAVFWWQSEAVLIAVPVQGGAAQGAAAAIVPLAPLYTRLRQYNKPVFVYIILNTIILSIVGLYRIFRIYLRPIDRIVRQADDYGQDEDLFFTFRQEDNELNRLSSALNRMLKRISEDKDKLRETVASLERSNAELKRAQGEIIRAEKMASVGRLAAGIAHEIGNPIGIVLGYLDLIRQPDLDRVEHDDFARRAESEIQRINTIIRQLLDLARPRESASQTLAAHAVIQDIVSVMAHQPMMADIQWELALDASEDRLYANADQLRQVFLNLLLNAADAIRGAGRDGRGRIVIATESAAATVPDQRSWLTITFQDNGEGIQEDRMASIFDPFYTTKEPGKGTGLGLSVSYMIIEKMGGAISVQSRLGSGTTFTIRLPLLGTSAEIDPGGAPKEDMQPRDMS